MAEEKEVRCRHCGSANITLESKWEEEQYGVDGEGGGTNYTYVGTDVKKDYKCNDCGKTFRTFEIKNEKREGA